MSKTNVWDQLAEIVSSQMFSFKDAEPGSYGDGSYDAYKYVLLKMKGMQYDNQQQPTALPERIISLLNKILKISTQDIMSGEPCIETITHEVIYFRHGPRKYKAFYAPNGEIQALEMLTTAFATTESAAAKWMTGILNGYIRDDEGNLHETHTHS